MICAQCDSSVTDDSRFCPQCGQATALADAPAASEAALTDMGTLAMSSTALQAVRATSHLATPVATVPAAPSLLDAEKLRSRLTQANLCRIRHDWSNAVDHCVAVLQEQPGNATAHSLLSDIYRDQGKLDDAIQWARLATDLKPSPADVAKLQKLEAERTNLMRQGDSRVFGSGLSHSNSMALAAGGGLPTGTINLMGVTPRRWLNGITTAAMVFVGAVLLVLLGMRYTRHAPPRETFHSYASASNIDSGNGLPPAPLPSRSSGMASSPLSASGGLPPDLRASTTGPRRKAAPANLPVAPVLSARPITPPASAPNPARRSGGAMGMGSGAAESADATSLPDGMWIASVQFPAGGNARVKIGINLSNPADLTPLTRAAIVRNVYRAAVRIFQKYDAVQQVSVTVATDPADSLIFTAEAARAAALDLNADSAPASQLESGLQSARWSVPEPAQNAGAPPSSGIPGVGP